MGKVQGKSAVVFSWCSRFTDEEKWGDLEISVNLFISPTDTKCRQDPHTSFCYIFLHLLKSGSALFRFASDSMVGGPRCGFVQGEIRIVSFTEGFKSAINYCLNVAILQWFTREQAPTCLSSQITGAGFQCPQLLNCTQGSSNDISHNALRMGDRTLSLAWGLMS
jgi:hypothetical protein